MPQIIIVFYRIVVLLYNALQSRYLIYLPNPLSLSNKILYIVVLYIRGNPVIELVYLALLLSLGSNTSSCLTTACSSSLIKYIVRLRYQYIFLYPCDFVLKEGIISISPSNKVM